MRREIKFRAYDIKQKIMFLNIEKGILCKNSKNETFLATSLESICNDKNVIVTQYTGLKDKKGNEIYEGDILKKVDVNIEIIVKYSEFYNCGCCGYVAGIGFNLEVIDYDNYEVIGNIFENDK